MYKAFLNDTLIYDPSGQILLGSSQLKQAKNEIGSFAFTIYDDNPGYALTSETLTGIVTVKQDEKIIYKGRIIRTYQTNPGELEVETEELTAYLRDTIQRPAEYHNMTVGGYLGQLLEVHNSQVEPEKQILLGAVTMQDAGSNLYRYTNDETTWDCIQSDLIDSLGGMLRIRYENGLQYLDYLRDYPRVTDQKIEFGENLLEFSKSGSVDDLATVCIPRGHKLEESPIEALEMRLDIASVNNGLDYVQIPEAVSRYGVIQKVVIWDNVTEPANLKQKAQAWLQDNQYESLMLELSAVDLADFGVQTQHLELLDEVVCSSAPHGMAHRFPLTAISIDITDPAASVYTLGTSQKTFSGSMRKVQHNLQAQLKAVPSKDRVLKEAQDHATAIINTMGRGGHVVFNPDSVSPEEILIMDTDDIETAERLWRWNLGGLGYSNNGYLGPFETAITMDGQIVGEFLTVHSLRASDVQFAWNDISKYIQFDNARLLIYDSDLPASQKLRMALDDQGSHFYRDGYYVGKIGSNQMTGNSSYKGLVMDLDYQAAYWSLSAKESEDSSYIMLMAYIQKNHTVSGYTTEAINLSCDFDMRNYRIIDPQWKLDNSNYAGITGGFNFVKVKNVDSNGNPTAWESNCSLTFRRGILVSASF